MLLLVPAWLVAEPPRRRSARGASPGAVRTHGACVSRLAALVLRRLDHRSDRREGALQAPPGPRYRHAPPEVPYARAFLELYGVWPVTLTAALCAIALREVRRAWPLLVSACLLATYASIVGDWMVGLSILSAADPGGDAAHCLGRFDDPVARSMGARGASSPGARSWRSRPPRMTIGWSIEAAGGGIHHSTTSSISATICVSTRPANRSCHLERARRTTRPASCPSCWTPTTWTTSASARASWRACRRPMSSFTEVGRYSPLTNRTPLRAAHAYVLALSPEFIIAPYDNLESANRGQHPGGGIAQPLPANAGRSACAGGGLQAHRLRRGWISDATRTCFSKMSRIPRTCCARTTAR